MRQPSWQQISDQLTKSTHGLNGEGNANRNPEWLGDFSQLQIQIKPKISI